MSTLDGWADHTVAVIYVTPGGAAVKRFADRYLTMRVCLGHFDHAEDGLAAELRDSGGPGWEPVPWESEAVRGEAIEELRRRARVSSGERRSELVRLLEHVRRTPYYDGA